MTAVAAEAPGITVAGRTFRPVTSRSDGKFVFDQYNWITTAIWSVPLGESRTMRDVMAAVAKSGQGPAILAGLVTEEAQDGVMPWSTEAAREWQTFFAGAHTIRDCLMIQAAIQQELPAFFPIAGDSSVSSTSASDDPATPASISVTPTNP